VGAWSKLVFPSGIDPRCSEVVEWADGKGRVYIGCDDGYVYFLQDPSVADWAVGSQPADAAAVDTEISGCWKPFREVGDAEPDLIADVSGDPALLHVRGYAAVKSTWTVTVQTNDAPDDTAPRESAISVEIGPGHTEKTIPIDQGDRISGKWCAWKAEHSASGEGGVIGEVVVMYIPQSTEGPD
jgi:hypothetical protein